MAYHAMIGVEPSPWLFVGASFRDIHVEGMTYRCGCGPNRFDTLLLSAALEVHPLGRFWADPYVTADIGSGSLKYQVSEAADSTSDEWEPPATGWLGAALGLGFALRGERFAIGPQATLVYMNAFSATAELRVDVRF
jgi:hypothetical protein